MAEPIQFSSQTPRFALPLLFAGQAQKEFYFNEAQSLVDALLHTCIKGVASTPPQTPAEGDCWLVGQGAQGQWSGHDSTIAVRVSADWRFIAPKQGTVVLDDSTGRRFFYDNGWQAASAPASPQGGSTVDQESRAAIDAIISTLRTCGILPRS